MILRTLIFIHLFCLASLTLDPSSFANRQSPQPGSWKNLPPSDATGDAAGSDQLFEAIHVPNFTDFREGLNGLAVGDVDGNGYLDFITVTTEPFALDTMPEFRDVTGNVQRTRDPRDRLRLLLNQGGFQFEPHEIALTGSAATPDDFSQGWRGAQVPALADFNNDGLLDIYVTRQAPMRGGRIMRGRTPVGNSLLISNGSFDRFRDVSESYGARNELAYNRQPSLGDVNLDGFLDIAIGADNVVNAFEGLPKSALFVFQPHQGQFQGGSFADIGGTALIPDFGGFYHNSDRDKAGPNLALRDIDNDGDLDLLQTTHALLIATVPPTTPYSPAEYRQGSFSWRNLTIERGRFRFKKSTNNGFANEARLRYDRAQGLLVPMSEARAPGHAQLIFGDVNNDGLLDVFSFANTNPFLRPSPEDVAARFWYNLGNFRFQEATPRSGLDVLERSYREWADFFEAPLPKSPRPFRPRRQLRSQPGLKPKNLVDTRPAYSDGVFADFNNDGWLDLVVLDRLVTDRIEARSILFMNRGDGTFEAKPTTFSGISGTGIFGEAADLNNDGLVDLIISADPDNTGVATDIRQYESMVFMNTGRYGGEENHWLRLRFSGVSDAELIGAHVEVSDPQTNRLVGMRGIYSHHSYKSSSALEAHFGLGKRDRVNVTVRLPGNQTITAKGVKSNRYLEFDLSQKTLTEVILKNLDN